MARRSSLTLGARGLVSAVAVTLAAVAASGGGAGALAPRAHVTAAGAVSTAASPAVPGYRLLAGDGGVFSFAAPFFGSAAETATACAGTSITPPADNCVAIATTTDGNGYWVLNGATGRIVTFGDAASYGTPGAALAGVPADLRPSFRQLAPTPTGKGYWVLAVGLSGLGSVEAFGTATSYGDETTSAATGGHVGMPVGMAATATGDGYWIADSDGGVFSYGDAVFDGSMGGAPLNAPIVGIAATPSGHGYWLVASDGGVFAFGDAAFYGSMGGHPLNAPVVGMAASIGVPGYWLVAVDGGVFTFGRATFQGSMGGQALNSPVVAISAAPPA